MTEKLILWQKKWETGVKDIDIQHKHFIGLINRAYAFNEGEKSKQVLADILTELVEYARIHFSTEEGYFENTDYPDTDEHILKHQELLGKVLNFTKRFEAKEDFSKLVLDFLKFLRDWLENHLVKVDHKYISWFKSHGVK